MTIFSQKGASLYIVILILAIVLAVVLGLSTILIEQMKMMRGLGYSLVAIYAADSGVERALKDLYIYFQDETPPPADYFGQLENGSEYNVDVYCCKPGKKHCLFVNTVVLPGEKACPGLEEKNECQGSFFCIESVGSFKGTKRAIETKI